MEVYNVYTMHNSSIRQNKKPMCHEVDCQGVVSRVAMVTVSTWCPSPLGCHGDEARCSLKTKIIIILYFLIYFMFITAVKV